MSPDFEQLHITNDLSEVIRAHNQALERLQAYREKYPYLMAPNLARLMEDNLKENTQVLYKELNNMFRPKQQQQRFVCEGCKSVFLQRLPGGLCDECRSRQQSSGGGYARVLPVAGVTVGAEETPGLEESSPASLVEEQATAPSPEPAAEDDARREAYREAWSDPTERDTRDV